ncbi:MAG TPA: AIPR family protein [Chloroflexota bacterium]|nr:AIPR family protein [Chloroflexota bacterium]
MANNELVLLDQVLKQRQDERATPMRDDDAFELFACEQAVRGRDISSEEVADGVVGGGNDGGIDGVYVFLGDSLLNEDSEVLQTDFAPGKVSAGSRLEMWLVQGKTESSFTETAVEKVADSTRRLLNLAEPDDDLALLYSQPVVTRTGFFRHALSALATRHPKVAIRFVYASRGRVEDINAKVQVKANDLEDQFKAVMPGATGVVEFLGAAELWKRANEYPSYTTKLTYQENATSGSSHVALVKLRDYMAFLADEHGELRRHIFDWNVRDYQGDVEVNREIRDSLQDPVGPEFWWLNNGVTIVCSRASVVGKTYALDDVQVVNGLQTSHTIFGVLQNAGDDHVALDRAVLVRILVTGDDPETRDRVIRATNRQTSVPAASLRATDDIQRDIEAYFLGHGWFYDRRKNFYRNNGKSPERIVSIPLLAQAMMAMGLSRPDNSRARPSSLLKRDEDYRKIFSSSIPLAIYLWLAQSQKAVDAFLLSENAAATAQERTNLRFHLAMVAAARLVEARVYNPAQLRSVVDADTPITDANLPACLKIVRESFEAFEIDTDDAPDKIAKGQDFIDFLLRRALPDVEATA